GRLGGGRKGQARRRHPGGGLRGGGAQSRLERQSNHQDGGWNNAAFHAHARPPFSVGKSVIRGAAVTAYLRWIGRPSLERLREPTPAFLGSPARPGANVKVYQRCRGLPGGDYVGALLGSLRRLRTPARKGGLSCTRSSLPCA